MIQVDRSKSTFAVFGPGFLGRFGLYVIVLVTVSVASLISLWLFRGEIEVVGVAPSNMSGPWCTWRVD